MTGLVFSTNNLYFMGLILQTNQRHSSINVKIFAHAAFKRGGHAAQLVLHIKETQSGHPNLPRELPFIHISLRPPALIHHSPVISHKAMGGSRSQAQLWLLVDDSLEGAGAGEDSVFPPHAASAQLPLPLLPSLNLALKLIPRLSSSPATYICFPPSRKRNYRPGSRSPER